MIEVPCAALPAWGMDLPRVVQLVDSSTGGGKISGRTRILARNNNQDNVFNISTVPHMHIWGAAGRPGDHAEIPMRVPALDYTQDETYELLCRYQGFGEQAESDAHLREPLYAIFEKYNAALRGD